MTKWVLSDDEFLDLRDERDAALSRVAELETVLQPFAACFHEPYVMSQACVRIEQVPDNTVYAGFLTVGDFGNAAKALAPPADLGKEVHDGSLSN